MRLTGGPEAPEGYSGQVERLREAVDILHHVMGTTDHAFREAVVEGYIVLPLPLRDRVSTTVAPEVHADYLRRIAELTVQAERLRAWARLLPEAGVEVPTPVPLDPVRLLGAMRRAGARPLPAGGTAPPPPALALPPPSAVAPPPPAESSSRPARRAPRGAPLPGAGRLGHTPLIAAGALVAMAAVLATGVALLRPGSPPARGRDAAATTVPVVAAPGLPAVRRGEALAAGPGSQEAVLFGGALPGGRLLDDTWIFDGRTWSQARPGVSPAARTGALAAYDGFRHQLVLTGGRGVAGELTDTWTWDGVGWTLQLPETPPRLGTLSAIAGDAAAHTVVLVTGAAGAPAQTWLWDGRNWRRVVPRLEPVLSGPPLMSADPLTGHVLLVTAPSGPGSAPATTWSWDGTSWSLRPQGPPVVVRPGASWMAADPASRHVLLFATGTAGGATWLWNGARWSYVFSSVAPPIGADGIASGLVTDPITNRPLLVGAGAAADPSRFRRGWVWRGTGWKAV